jgi:hypothetical protein
MTRYFFHVANGRDMPDPEGSEFSEMTAVREAALRTAGELLREGGDAFWQGHEWRMQVLDEDGNEALTLRFSAEQPAR